MLVADDATESQYRRMLPHDPDKTLLLIIIGALALMLIGEVFFDAVSRDGVDVLGEEGWGR